MSNDTNVTRPGPPIDPMARPTPSQQAPGDVAAWLDRCEAEFVHPGEIGDRLFRAGWHPEAVRAAVASYRSRFNQHTLGYTALLVATGIAALAAGSAGHLLAAGISEPVNRDGLGFWLTLMVCALPFAVWAHVWAARTDGQDPIAVWSVPRRSLATVLLWACGIVGIGRLLVYTAQLIGVVVGASWASGVSLVEGAVNVAITVGIALPLGIWAHRFLHRFDREDPTAPVVRTRLETSSSTVGRGQTRR
ncbi:MAG: hypothetical protein ACRD0A_03510 [Acidimicrobiales bacterium]